MKKFTIAYSIKSDGNLFVGQMTVEAEDIEIVKSNAQRLLKEHLDEEGQSLNYNIEKISITVTPA